MEDYKSQFDSLAHLEERLGEFYRQATDYFDTAESHSGEFSDDRKRLAGFIPDGSKVLEVACGSAANAVLLKDKKCEYAGIDIGLHGLKLARERLQMPECCFVNSSIWYLPFKDKIFDVVFSTYAMEHFVWVEQGIHEQARVLKDNGILIILCPGHALPHHLPASMDHLDRERKRNIFKKRCLSLFKSFFGKPFFEMNADPAVLHQPYQPDRDLVYLPNPDQIRRVLTSSGFELIYQKKFPESVHYSEPDCRFRFLKRLIAKLPLLQSAYTNTFLVFRKTGKVPEKLNVETILYK